MRDLHPSHAAFFAPRAKKSDVPLWIIAALLLAAAIVPLFLRADIDLGNGITVMGESVYRIASGLSSPWYKSPTLTS